MARNLAFKMSGKPAAPKVPKPVSFAKPTVAKVGTPIRAAQNLGGSLSGQSPAGGAAGLGAQPAVQVPAPAPAPSGLDATYMANTNTNAFNVGNKINALNLKSSADQNALQSTLGQLEYAQPRAQLALEQKENGLGALYSSVANQNQGNLAQQYLMKTNAAEAKYGAPAQDTIAAQIAALQGGIPLYNASQAAASTGRATTAANADQSLGATGNRQTPAQIAAFNARFNANFNRNFLAKQIAKKGRK